MATAVMRTADRHAPAGPNRTTDRARPRRASSRATHPPSELPTMCARSIPARSSCSATPSASAPTDGATPGASRSAPQWPGRVGANTACQRSSSGNTGRHTRQVPPTPCRSTSGVPEPPAYEGATGMASRTASGAGRPRSRSRRVRATAAAPAAVSRAALVSGQISGVPERRPFTSPPRGVRVRARP